MPIIILMGRSLWFQTKEKSCPGDEAADDFRDYGANVSKSRIGVSVRHCYRLMSLFEATHEMPLK